jgi:hypothetical protein
MKKPGNRGDPLFEGYEHIINTTKMLRSPDNRPMLELERQSGNLIDAIRYVGNKKRMPRVNPAEEEKKKAEQRLATLQQ